LIVDVADGVRSSIVGVAMVGVCTTGVLGVGVCSSKVGVCATGVLEVGVIGTLVVAVAVGGIGVALGLGTIDVVGVAVRSVSSRRAASIASTCAYFSESSSPEYDKI
jgi:hypothetical protein